MRAGVEIERDATVYCNDGPIGRVRQIVVDAAGERITDLIVERPEGGELVVPTAIVIHADGRTVTLGVPRARLLGDGAASFQFHREDFRPLDAREAPPAPPAATGRPRAGDFPEGRVAAPAADTPGTPAAEVPVTTDPAEFGAFAPGVLRIPLRGEQLFAGRKAVVARELLVRKTKRQGTVELRETVRKERIEVVDNEDAGAGS